MSLYYTMTDEYGRHGRLCELLGLRTEIHRDYMYYYMKNRGFMYQQIFIKGHMYDKLLRTLQRYMWEEEVSGDA